MTEPAAIDRRARARLAFLGAIAGALAFVVATRLGLVAALGVERLLGLDEGWLFWIAALCSAALSVTRARALVAAPAAALAVLYAAVAFTPLFVPWIHAWLLREEPRAADAIVVLSSDVTSDGHLSNNGVTRLLTGLALARAGHAPLVVRTELPPPHADSSADARDIASGTDVEIVMTGPVASTRDEAVETARLARERGIRRVIVVTNPMHERRAAAAFRAVGLEVIACPAGERGYSVTTLTMSEDRVHAFQDWVTELSAWSFYSIRGWVRE